MMKRAFADSTVTTRSLLSGHAPAGAHWSLMVALDCARPSTSPMRIGLAGVTEIEVGRGAARSVTRLRGRLRLELDDPRASSRQLLLRRSANEWQLKDAGSKNGTYLNGERVEETSVDDGDVIECGGTFLVLRGSEEPAGDLELTGGDALATLLPSLELELAALRKIARSSANVLVRGESGTGKELVAIAVHAIAEPAGPFVAANCAAIPSTLLESELFGTRRGAFSGAEDRPGLVRGADRGTLFLDEIAELPPTAQAALLRFLQDGEIMPLGAGKSSVVKLRVVAATNRPLEDDIAAGRFRGDLYARLRGYEITLPPLRRRMEDLGLIVTALLRRLEPGRPARPLSRRTARALFQHDWPYNVRELEQVLRAALAVAAGDEIQHTDLPTLATAAVGPGAAPSERQRVASLLTRHGGNLTAVARAMATSRSQVKRLLARHGFAADEFRRRG